MTTGSTRVGIESRICATWIYIKVQLGQSNRKTRVGWTHGGSHRIPMDRAPIGIADTSERHDTLPDVRF